jgi:predicted short-subunit dehydrogenase-like oxidoreductase (DUF2520 family)
MIGNYVVALAGAAARLGASAGVPADLSAKLYLPLMVGALENLERQSPAVALTGPVRRGDLSTIRAHLAALGADDRVLYAVLGLEALRLAREAGLDPVRADEVGQVLRSAIILADRR